MPREVKAYVCEHGCGRSPFHIRESVLAHETVCAFNPQVRACPTCSHHMNTGDLSKDCLVGADEKDGSAAFECPFWRERTPAYKPAPYEPVG